MQEYNRCYATINLGAIRHNIGIVRERTGYDVALIAVVKADAYGHGAVPVARSIEDRVDAFGVASVEEGLELREAGISLPVLILGYSSPCQYAEVLAHNLTPSIYSFDDAKILSHCAEQMNMMGKVHIPLDTGMTRIGFRADENAAGLIERIAGLKNIFVEGVFSHLACADMENDTYSDGQFREFETVKKRLEEKNIRIPVHHICNSAGILNREDHYEGAVRSGIITYGITPSGIFDRDAIGLVPALEWKTHVIHIADVEPGRGVSYGATYVTDKPTKIATLAAGYADGYPRSLSNRGKVLINGRFAPVIGRVCMDLMMADVTGIPGVHIESRATLIGRDGDNDLSVEDFSSLAGTIPYETVCRISKRVKRIYHESPVAMARRPGCLQTGTHGH